MTTEPEFDPESTGPHHDAEVAQYFTAHPDIFTTELTDDNTTARARLLTAEEAAAMLNIPLPALTRMLEEGQLPYLSQGRRIRIRADSVLAFQETLHTRRAEALDRMQTQSQADGLYDILNTTMYKD